jgi:shikimate dehydrogenase
MRFVLVGHPVAHSVSPAMHRVAYQALGIDARYDAVDCADRNAVSSIVAQLRAGTIAGVNVTIPHKRLALELADRVDPLAASTGAANVLAREAGAVVAHNTDVSALIVRFRELRPEARRFAILGSGGAALAVTRAAAELGAERIAVCARRFRGDRANWPNAQAFERIGAELWAWEAAVPFEQSDVIVQATSAGMLGADSGQTVRDRVPWSELAREAVALDLVYNPKLTPFLAAARARGLAFEGGLPMLVGQALGAIELWLGRRPPADALLREAARALEAP